MNETQTPVGSDDSNHASFSVSPPHPRVPYRSASSLPRPLRKACSSAPSEKAAACFEPLQLGPKFLLANAERDGEKYAVSPSLISNESRALYACGF